jgi:hypothetical protein
MAIRAQALTVSYTAWNVNTGLPKTGDAANHALRWMKDGTDAAATNGPTEIANGEYKLTLTAAETACDFGVLHGSSSTSGVVLVPVKIDFVRLPAVDPGAAGGLPTVDATGGVSVAALAASAIDAIWDEPQAGHATAGTFGFYLDATISGIGGGSGSGSAASGTYLADLVATRDNIAIQLADLTANPKPTYSIDGQEVDWDTHFRTLSERLESLNRAIQAAEPFEIHTTGYST